MRKYKNLISTCAFGEKGYLCTRKRINIMRKNVISKYGYTYRGVSLDSVSQTVPDQSLSVEDILRRFTTGSLAPADIERDVKYGEDVSPDEDFDNLDPRYDPDYDLVDAYNDAAQAATLAQQLAAAKRQTRAAANTQKSDGTSAPSDVTRTKDEKRTNKADGLDVNE